MDSILAEGPNGCTSSSRTMRPLGFCRNVVSRSTGLSERAISCMSSTILPALAKSVASMRCFPLTRRNLKSTMSSMLRPIHDSGRSIMPVSPNSGGSRGPISTLGYPYLPTKTDGGLEPDMLRVSIIGRTFCRE